MELAQFLNKSLTFISTFALRCAAELGISDHIHAYGRPMPLNELARSIPIPPEKDLMLGQLMQLLIEQGVYAQSDAGYTLTPLSELMLSEGSNMRVFVRLMADPALVKPWYGMSEWFKSTEPGTMYQMAHDQKTYWQVMKERPEIGKIFNEAMASQSRQAMKGLVAAHPHLFEGVKSLVDVGGGTGTTVKIIAEAFPQLKCTVLDQPHVIANALKSDAFTAVGGNMFEKIPSADAVFLRNVLHDWRDDDCVKILQRCKEAIAPAKKGGRIIIGEITVDLKSDDHSAKETCLFFDLYMMSSHGSLVRSRKEWHDIFLAAGFPNYKIHTFGIESIYVLSP